MARARPCSSSLMSWPNNWANADFCLSDSDWSLNNTSAIAAVCAKFSSASIKSSKSLNRLGSNNRNRAKWLSKPNCSGVAVSNNTPAVCSAKSSTKSYLSLPPCSLSQCRWCASSTTSKSNPASKAFSCKSSWSSSKSMLAIINCSVVKGFCSGSCSAIAAVLTKSKIANSRLKRRRISIIHWYCKLSGTKIKTRSDLPVINCWWIIRPASIVLPSPTSSASSTRGAIRLPTSWAIYSWCSMISTRAPIKPLSGWDAK